MPKFYTQIGYRLRAAILAAASLCATSAISATDWMADINDGAYVCQLSIPGSHDSATGHGFTGFLGGLVGPSMATTQDLTITQQWEAGIRAFDLRPGVLDGSLEIYHGVCQTKLSFASALETICTLLDEHPTEFAVILMRHENDADNNDTSWSSLMAETTAAPQVASHLMPFSSRLTVEQARGKIIMLSRDIFTNDNLGRISGWSHSPEFADQCSASIRCGRTSTRLFVQDFYECTADGDTTRKLRAIQTMLDSSAKTHLAPDEIPHLTVNHTSGYTRSASTDGNRELAAHTNTTLAATLRDNDFIPGPTGIVLMDFAGSDTSGNYEVNGLSLTNAIIDNNYAYTPLGLYQSDAITAVATDTHPSAPNVVFDLAGRPVSADLSSLAPGIYIVNGRKLLIR